MINTRMLKAATLNIGALLALSLTLIACGNDTARQQPSAQSNAAVPAPAATGPQTPDPGHRIITVEALTDDQGNNVFRPAQFEAHRGDVIRFTLKSGVHNIHFLPDSNPGKAALPAASDLLQLPGQTYDLKILLEPGTYYFQCDPHALLGMKGHVKVEGD
ncbi:MAG TPA: plastocyanin/azurin family copper-binding protein [Gemmatimonadaceae bacterium]|nr:plastocyanin/azurin family copper-binding protein [Gemmatimonadaceae bacterium]